MSTIKKVTIENNTYNFSMKLKTINGENLNGDGNIRVGSVPDEPSLLFEGYSIRFDAGTWVDYRLPDGWQNYNALTFFASHVVNSSIIYGNNFTIPVALDNSYYFRNTQSFYMTVEGMCDWDSGMICFRFSQRSKNDYDTSSEYYFINSVMGV